MNGLCFYTNEKRDGYCVMAHDAIEHENDNSESEAEVEAVSPSLPCDSNTLRNAVILVDAFRKILKASWNTKERVWIFPPSSLSTAEEVLCSVPGLAVEVHKLERLTWRGPLSGRQRPLAGRHEHAAERYGHGF